MERFLLLPVHLLNFWYLESLIVFVRSWKNLVIYLEEDMAVTLMWKLFFVPLFHDASFVGRILSIIFRLIRITLGVCAFFLATILVAMLAAYWFTLPLLAAFNILGYWSLGFFLSGIGLFLIHTFTHPHKKVWQVGGGDIWSASWVKKGSVDLKRFLQRDEVKEFLSYLETTPDHFYNLVVIDSDKVAQDAFEMAKKNVSEYIHSTYFFVALIKNCQNIEDTLLKLNLRIEDFEGTLLYLEKRRNKWRRVWLWDDDFAVHHLKGVNRGWLGVPTPTLDSVSEDITLRASKQDIPDFLGNLAVVERVVNILSQDTNKNVILVGPPGSGKSSLIRHLAKQIVTGDAPAALATKRLVMFDLSKLLSGMKTQGDLADRIKDVFEEVSFAENIIIVVDEIHNLGIGEAGSSLNLFSLMSPYLESDKFQFLATTETENYTRILEKNGSFSRLFSKVELAPATTEQTLDILEYKAIKLQRTKKIKTSYLALKLAVELAVRLIRDRVLPDSAITLLEEAGSQQVQNGWITTNKIKTVISDRVNVPVMEVGNVEKEKLLNLEDLIHQKMIDQEPAVRSVSDTLRRGAVSMRDQTRPIGSFLFVGPTGVGKTELAKTLAEVYFKGSGVFVRFDMSEYQNPQSVDRLIGASGEGGQLTEAIRNKPYALLLLDEFEKADPKILTLFLQVLEDGRLTDGAGRTIDFTNTIIIATSNAASLTIAQQLGLGKTIEQIDAEVNNELLEIFRPELINRFDDVVIFKPLSNEDLQKIVRLKLTSLQKQLKEQGYVVEFGEDLVAELAKRGFDPVLGARPLRRLIQATLESKLSRMILEDKLTKGNKLQVGVDML